MLGDMLCAVPALRALRAALPEAEIVLVGLPWARAFAERFERYLDELLPLPGFPGLPEEPTRLAELPSFLGEVHRRRFDLAVQLHGSGRVTNLLTALLGARETAGFVPSGEPPPAPGWFLGYPEGLHEIETLLRLVEFLGAPRQGEGLEFPLRDEDRTKLRTLPEAGELEGADYVCVHPGARTSRWAPERFAAVADALAAEGLRVVLTGSATERELVTHVARRMRAPALDLAGRTSVGSLAALLERSRLLVVNDTGVSHLAVALGVPSVVVFHPRQVRRWAPLERERHRVVLQEASADEVTAEAVRLLGTPAPA